VVGVTSGNRVKRLRELVDQLERLPESPERDRMLREVRARVVDVDTGAVPRAVLPVDPDATPAADPGSPAPQAPRAAPATPAGAGRLRRAMAHPEPAKRAHVPPREAEPRPRPNVAADGPSRGTEDLLALAADELLSLDDSEPVSESEGQSGSSAAPWTRGLRG
jgi:hypothetical protein